MSARQRRHSKGRQVANDYDNDVDGRPIAAAVTEQPLKAIKKLLHWDDLPRWQRDNRHIYTGYRPASSSFLISIQSLTYFHNETVNIYTHLLPSLLVIPAGILLYHVLAPRYGTASHSDILVFGCFFAGVAFCLGMSATYHTISNHSPLVARVGNTLDYVGIIGLIAGSFTPSVYYGFFCAPALQRLYWSMIYIIGLGCTCVCTIPRFRAPEWRSFRATLFVSMGLSAVFPVVHGLLLYGVRQMTLQIGLGWLLLQGFLYILGAVIYAARVPERLSPGTFDMMGSSHQIFHVLVVCAALAHLTGLLRAFDYRHSGIAEKCWWN
ncbi:hemolysin-III related domain containing protein [Elaphomyces granulatus]|jgi:adiponectin receptor